MARVENDSSEEENNDIEVIFEDGDEPAVDNKDDDSEIESDLEIDDEEESEIALEAEVKQLEASIESDPYNYEYHSKLIYALESLNDLKRLRLAFDRLRSRALPDSNIWLIRLRAETSMAHTDEQKETVVAMFEDAIIECYSREMYLELVSTGLRWHSEGNSSCSEKVLRLAWPSSSCLHIGHVLYAAKLEIYTSTINRVDTETAVKQYVELFNSAFSRPLASIDNIVNDFKSLPQDIAQHLPQDLMNESRIRTLKELAEMLMKHEDKLFAIEDKDVNERLKIYTEYIEYTKQLMKQEQYKEIQLIEFILLLYERASYECRDSAEISTLLKGHSEFVKGCGVTSDRVERSLSMNARRGPRVADFYLELMVYRERIGSDVDKMKGTLEESLTHGFDSVKDYETIWWQYLTWLKRISDLEGNTQHVDRMRSTLRLASNALNEMWGGEADPECNILKYWAELEYTFIKDYVYGREILEEILTIGDMATQCNTWQLMIRLECLRGASTNKVRALYRRALRRVRDYTPGTARDYLMWERIYGTLDDVMAAEKLAQEAIDEWKRQYEELKQKKLQANSVKNKHSSKHEDRKPVKRKNESGSEQDVVKKAKDEPKGVKRRGDGDSLVNESFDVKKFKNAPLEEELVPTTLFVSNLPHGIEEDELRKKLMEYGVISKLRIVKGVKSFGGSIAYCTYVDQESIEKALLADRTPLAGRPMFLSRARSTNTDAQTSKLKYQTGIEKHKLFVKNLPFTHCNKVKLNEIFGQYGELKDIRVVTFKDGKPKGLAYIEYKDVHSATKALRANNGLSVEGHQISVAYSDPPKRNLTKPLSSNTSQPSTHMRRTQLSHFLPRALAVSKQQENGHSTTNKPSTDKPLSNTDFRNLLLKN